MVSFQINFRIIQFFWKKVLWNGKGNNPRKFYMGSQVPPQFCAGMLSGIRLYFIIRQHRKEVMMKIHSMDDEMEMEFNSLEIGSAYFREMYGTDEKGTYIEHLFPKLDMLKQQMVITLIQGLLSGAKRDAFLGVYLQAFLNNYRITYVDLAKYITAYINYSVGWQAENGNVENLDMQGISSKLQRFLKSNKGKEDNEYLKLVSGFFSVSPSVLITGKGERYSIDLEELKRIVDGENLDVDTFLDRHFQMDFDSEGISTEEEKEQYKKYIHYNASVFAGIVAEQLDIDIEDILVTEKCWIELEDFPIKEYYNRLTDENMEVVRNVLFYLNVKL